MTEKQLVATTTISAPAKVVFAVLADPNTHAAIDGTGWVRQPLDSERLREPGQIFRMAMYNDNHPNKFYEMVNKVVVCDPPNAISWKPGQDVSSPQALLDRAPEDGNLAFGGWIWRYDLMPVGPSETEVRLTYDWSAVPPSVGNIEFPPFAPEHLDNSLRNLAGLAVQGAPA